MLRCFSRTGYFVSPIVSFVAEIAEVLVDFQGLAKLKRIINIQ